MSESVLLEKAIEICKQQMDGDISSKEAFDRLLYEIYKLKNDEVD